MFEEDSRPVNSLASLSPPSSDLRKGPEGLWKQALFMLRGMLRRSVSPDVPNRISSKFHDVAASSPGIACPKFPPDFLLRSSAKSPFFLIRHVFPVFSSSIPCSGNRHRGKRDWREKFPAIFRANHRREFSHTRSPVIRVTHKGL